MDKKKSKINLEKLTNIIKPMTRLQLNKFVSNLNKQLKINNASKMKRTELEAELLARADIIIDMIDNDKELKLFDTTTKPREYKITKEEETQLSKDINELSQKAIEEENIGTKQKLIKEARKKAAKLAKSTIKENDNKTTPKKEETKKKTTPVETFEMLSKKFDELSNKILKEKNQGVKQKMMKESSEIMDKMIKMS